MVETSRASMRILPSGARKSLDADCCSLGFGAANFMIEMHSPHAGGRGGAGGGAATADPGYHARERLTGLFVGPGRPPCRRAPARRVGIVSVPRLRPEGRAPGR